MTQAIGALPPAQFSTIGLPEQHRIELWEGHNASALIGLHCRTLDSKSLEATEINVQLDRLNLARVTGNPHVVERSATLIRANPSDAIALYFNLVGEAFFYYESGVRMLRPGQMLICDADRPFMRGFSGGLEELVVKVPRSLFAEVSGVKTLTSPVVMDFARSSNMHANVFARIVSRAARSIDPKPAEESTLLDLLSTITVPGNRDLSSVHRAAAQAFIDDNLVDLNLSASTIARGIRISERHLSRVFAKTETTIPRYIMNRRLDLAHDLLRRDAAVEQTIADIAHRCGFTAATHFSHVFRKKFGLRASDVRREAQILRTNSSN